MDVVRSGTTTTIICVTSFVVVLATAMYQWTMKPLRILQSIGIPIADGFKPFVGHVLEENKQKHVGEFYVECLRKYGKMYGMVEFRSSAVVVADQEMLKEILTREFNYFTDRRFIPLRGWMEKSMLEQKGAEWKRIRTMITPFFSSGKMKQHTNIMIQCSNTLLENLRIICSSNASNCFNARSVAEAYAMDVICGCGYGLNTDSQNNPDHPLISTMRRISNISMVNPKLFLAFTFPALGSLMSACGMSMFPSNYLKFFESTVRQLIDERKKNPAEREDFLDTLVKAEEDFIQQQKEQNANNTNNMTTKGLNKEEVLAQALLFFLAGYDTTAGALSFLMYNLAIHPHIQGKLYEEIRQHFGGNELPGYENVQKLHYLDCCINESLRLYPASFILDREAVDDVTVLGVHLPKGTGVIVPIWAIHRDPQIWPDPDSFKPDRFLADDKEGCMGQLEYSLLQFGAGQRACIGARFARLEVKIAITRILSVFELKPNERTQIPLEMETGLFVHPKDGVWLSLSPRS